MSDEEDVGDEKHISGFRTEVYLHMQDHAALTGEAQYGARAKRWVVKCEDALGYTRWFVRKPSSSEAMAGFNQGTRPMESAWDWAPTSAVVLFPRRSYAELVARQQWDEQIRLSSKIPPEFKVWVEEVELDIWLAAVRLVESDLD